MDMENRRLEVKEMRMTVKEILKEWLLSHGYEGLCGDQCGCDIDDLILCDGTTIENCIPGHKVPCDPNDCELGRCDWHMKPGKKEEEDESKKDV